MNGYSYNGGYDPNSLDHGEQYGEDSMMMGQDGVGNGMMGGQSLDEIVDQTAKTIRRQSMPHGYGSSPRHADGDMRRISMMDYNGASPAGPMNNFGFEPSASMEPSGMMPTTSPAHVGHSHQSRNLSRRQSRGELGLNTTFGGTTPAYSAMLPPSSAFASPAHPPNSIDLGMNSPFLDPNMNMSMDYGMPQSANQAIGPDPMSMNLYNQPQFNNSVTSSPMHPNAHQGTPHLARSDTQNSGMNTQYGGQTAHSSTHTARNLSRSHSMHVQDGNNSSAGTPMSQPPPSGPKPQPPQQHPSGFRGQPQHPQPGSSDDRGMGNTGTQKFDGINGPFPVDPNGYNPNNQGFNWEPQEGGWPSTMVGKPHMQSSYKNAYSSTGFDMLGVLVCL
jgi:hypothetical protein